MSVPYLPGVHRGKYMRYDTAVILKRFYLCERMLVVGQAGWLPGIPYFDIKTTLPKLLWEDAMTGHALRERVFELRFPSRILETGEDQPLIDFLKSVTHAPSALAYLMVVSRLIKPAMKEAYRSYLDLADEIGDGPTYRFMELAIEEKTKHIEHLENFIPIILDHTPEAERSVAEQWFNQQKNVWEQVGGISLETPYQVEGIQAVEAFVPSEIAVREDRFIPVRFYWPDNIDATFPYGSGFQLQLRSAVSHMNEVWAVENAGFILCAFADTLGWDYIYDAARWLYDESRHCRMGYERLKSWGFEDAELPLGTYIFDSCRGQDPIYRLGMLFYFESKNIGKKIDRIKNFEKMNDRMSQHDMDFDWADETIHTSYGKTWLSALLKKRGLDPDDYTKTRDVCESLVKETLKTATPEEMEQIRGIAHRMYVKAEQLL
ncbi:DUF455 family protein [Paenibacillus eucommiae]|uniref:Uncharacterized ferritin-like protein (DUF455 family) n=1 Tax=Paenibacillus eucommiae TaxID=1355755 RepID=A0ABS4IX15_9BACL|nr:DUF455 family protein [Paenibacillus eucommiae]MBP1992136.1 uncharacterized ferritin-like protein (DUF455 family) [Paenibacillus eucommiae]